MQQENINNIIIQDNKHMLDKIQNAFESNIQTISLSKTAITTLIPSEILNYIGQQTYKQNRQPIQINYTFRSPNNANNYIKLLTFIDKKSKIECKCVYNNSKLLLSNKYSDKYTDFKISQDSNIHSIKKAHCIIDSLITESRADGNFGIESSLINAKLTLLNHNSKNVLIAPINWNDEHFISMQDENFIQNIKNNSNITDNTKLVIVPIFYQNHISTLVIENTQPEKLALFDSSTAHLEKNNNELQVKHESLNSNIVKNIEILNTENLQDLNLNSSDLIQKVKDYSLQQERKLKKGTKEEIEQFNLKKSKSETNIENVEKNGNKIHLGNCGYYALHFTQYIVDKQYTSIEQIKDNIKTIKEQIQQDIEKELNYTDEKVLYNYLTNINTAKAYTKRAMHAEKSFQTQIQTPPTMEQTQQHVLDFMNTLNKEHNNHNTQRPIKQQGQGIQISLNN